MGAVYRAEHTMMRRDLAIKVLLPELGGKEEFARRFEREAESASRLTHPNIITVTDFGRTPEGSLFLVMEFLAGESLSRGDRRRGRCRRRARSAIMRQILRALEHAHAAGVVHRDLKPENIMLVERDGQRDVVKILDFGIAKVTQPQSGGEALTQAGVIFGTPEYLSPEQALGEAVDARADIYAAGVILYEMLAGRRPFESEDKVKIISMHLSHAPPRIRDVNPTVDVPLPLEQAVMQAMEKTREHRFATATAFLQALDDAEAPTEASGAYRTHAAWPAPRAGAGEVLAPRDGRGARPAGGRGRRRWRWSAGGSWPSSATAGHAAALVAAPPKPAPAPPDMADRYKKVEGWLEDGNLASARRALEQALSERPKDGRVRYMLGRVAFADDKHQEALVHYREAIALDAGLPRRSGAAVAPRHAAGRAPAGRRRAGSGDREDRRARGRPAGEGRQRGRRPRRAGSAPPPPWTRSARASASTRCRCRSSSSRRRRSCEEKKVVVVKLKDLGDVRALPALRALARPRGWARCASAAPTRAA